MVFSLIIVVVYGVTLLAFGNGAPDVFAALSASSDNDSMASGAGEGFYLAAAGSLGSGLFVSSIVSSAVILYTATNRHHSAVNIPDLSLGVRMPVKTSPSI
jgi:Ca2+/Na+ antiporter